MISLFQPQQVQNEIARRTAELLELLALRYPEQFGDARAEITFTRTLKTGFASIDIHIQADYGGKPGLVQTFKVDREGYTTITSPAPRKAHVISAGDGQPAAGSGALTTVSPLIRRQAKVIRGE